MRIARLVSFLLLIVGIRHATADEARKHPSLSLACVEFNKTILDRIENGRLKDAKAELSAALDNDRNGLEKSCDWMLLYNMAAVLSASGRLTESENLAARSVAILEKVCEPDDPIMLRPLQILGSIQFGLGKIARARETLRRMQLVRIKDLPVQRALIHGMSAAFFETEGRPSEAEREYLLALAAWEEGGLGKSANSGAILYTLGNLYISLGRFEDARQTLRRASEVLDASRDAVPMDRINLLNQQAVLHVRLGEWQKAEEELRTALSIVDRDAEPDPARMATLLTNYGYILRKNHRSREARTIDARLAALPTTGPAGRLIDASELRAESQKSRK